MTQVMDERNLVPNNRTLALHGIRPMSEENDLCIRCEEVFNQMIWPQSDESTENPSGLSAMFVGWLDRIIATKPCTLCQLLARTFRRSSNGFPESEIANHRRIMCLLTPNGPVSSETGITLRWKIDIDFVDLCKDDDPNIKFETLRPLKPCIRLLAGSAEVLVEHPDGYRDGDKLFDLARPVMEQCSTAFIRKTYNICLREHGQDCDAVQGVFGAPIIRTIEPISSEYPSKLIDVIDRRIVKAPKDVRYLALSYCWAKEPYPVLLKSNLEGLSKKHGLDLGLLAPTIADSIEVVAIMGERYLWVDALCIVQDDDEMKMAEINQMSTIYRNASVTIVAANSDGEGSDPGLPGIRPGSRPVRQDVVEIRELKFAVSLPDLPTIIQASRWHTRCWTFQEHHLSRRELVFTPYQAFFVCKRDRFSEDHIESACVHIGTYDNDQPCCAYQTPAVLEKFDFDSETDLNSYESLARRISVRSLSFESDALNAMIGILSVMKEESNTGFWFGLPVPYLLGYFALWIPGQEICRRTQGGFPSWTWVGWVGGVTYPITGQLFDGKIRCSESELVPSDTISVLIPTDGKGDHIMNGKAYSKSRLMSMDQFAISGSLLQFRAATIKTLVSSFAWGTFSDCIGRDSRCHAIIVKDSCAGLIIFNRGVRLPEDLVLTSRTYTSAWHESKSEYRQLDLIALSETCMHWSLYFPINSDPDNTANWAVLDEDGDFDHDHLPFDVSVWPEKDFELVNVMVVEYEDGVAYRVGVGQIHRQAWDMEHPVTTTVTLG